MTLHRPTEGDWHTLCWHEKAHSDGIVLTVCCWCGTWQEMPIFEPPEVDHGPHAKALPDQRRKANR